MRIRTKAPDGLNQPSRWNQSLRPWLDVPAWQKRIDDRYGLNKRGQSIIVLRWGQEITTRCWGDETPRYWLKRKLNTVGPPTYWTVPRWIFETRLEPEQYFDSWTATRYSMRDPVLGGSPKCEDCGCTDQPVLIGERIYCKRCAGSNISGGLVVDKGPPPDEYFTYLMDASEHESVDSNNGWAACCTRAFYSSTKFGTAGSRCWGEYRPPGAVDMEIIGRLAQQLEASKIDPYRELSPAELAEAELTGMKQMERAEENFAAYERELAADFNKQHGWRLTETDAGAHHHGHFFDQAKNSGIVLTDGESTKESI